MIIKRYIRRFIVRENLGERIQFLRKELRLSQETLAEQVGVSRQAISKWECNEAVPDLNNLTTLAERLNMTVDELINGEGIPEVVSVTLVRMDLKKRAEKFIVIAISIYIIGMFSFAISPLSEELTSLLFGMIAVISTVLIIKAAFANDQFKRLNNIEKDKKNEKKISREDKARRASFLNAVSMITIAIYLYIGLAKGNWSPSWLIFVTIPVAYSLYNAFAIKPIVRQ